MDRSCTCGALWFFRLVYISRLGGITNRLLGHDCWYSLGTTVQAAEVRVPYGSRLLQES